ncbi:MAG: zinc transporter ZntB [Silicimonas sp.]|nr:zinc transporter ZntB [Silicimonas sp.]
MTRPPASPLCAFDIRPDGRSEVVDLTAEALPDLAEGYRWFHFDLNHSETESWLKTHLPPLVVEALTQAETRPRCMQMEGGLFLTLRGVNLNPGANSDDMVSVRLWATETQIISARVRKIWAVDAIRQEMEAGAAPVSVTMFLADLCQGLTKRIEKVSLELVEHTDELEENTLTASPSAATSLATLRQSVIKLRRFVRPQNEAMADLAAGDLWPLDETSANFLRETSNRTTRIVEELDATSDRLQALQDHADMLHATTLGRNSYVLSVVAAIFLPLGFLTGLFGINVGGMPGVEAAYGFWIVTISSAVLGIVLFLVFRFLKWL